MTSFRNFRVIGTAFLCCGLGCLVAALSTRQPLLLGAGAPFVGAGIVFLGKSRQPD